MLLLALAAWAGDWAQEPIEPELPTEFSAYTLGLGHGRIGLYNQDVGVWHNVDVGTTVALFVLGVPNAHVKIDAVQSNPLHLALNLGWHGYNLEKSLDVPGGYLTVVPFGLVASVKTGTRFSLHTGASWLIVHASGDLGLDDLGEGIANAIGVDLSEELEHGLADSGALYAGADLSLFQVQLGGDFRINRRDALVLQTNTFVYLDGTVSGGYETEDASTEVGATLHVHKPLTDQLQSVITLSWQFDWKHWYLRVGIPVPTKTIPLLWIGQAFEFNYQF